MHPLDLRHSSHSYTSIGDQQLHMQATQRRASGLNFIQIPHNGQPSPMDEGSSLGSASPPERPMSIGSLSPQSPTMSHQQLPHQSPPLPSFTIPPDETQSRRLNPVAIPNLTKKARGRAVPTKETLPKPGSNGRTFACKVEDCRKVFTRSEHLKRHIRSIHTNERPFRCDEIDCGKYFTRHDNLLQHQRSHRMASSSHSRNSSASDVGPLDRIQYSLREPLDTSASGTMGVLLPSPMTTSPIAYSHLQLDVGQGQHHHHHQHPDVLMHSSASLSPDLGLYSPSSSPTDSFNGMSQDLTLAYPFDIDPNPPLFTPSPMAYQSPFVHIPLPMRQAEDHSPPAQHDPSMTS